MFLMLGFINVVYMCFVLSAFVGVFSLVCRQVVDMSGPGIRLSGRVREMFRRVGDVFGVSVCRDVKSTEDVVKCLTRVVEKAGRERQGPPFECFDELALILRKFLGYSEMIEEAQKRYVSGRTALGDSPISREDAKAAPEVRRAIRHVYVDVDAIYLAIAREVLDEEFIKMFKQALLRKECRPYLCAALERMITRLQLAKDPNHEYVLHVREILQKIYMEECTKNT